MNAEFTINGKILETERLILRAFEADDLDDFFAYASVEGVGEMAGWPHHENIETTQIILNDFIKHDKTFALVDKQTNKVIGSLGVEQYDRKENLSEFDGLLGRELGFVLSKEYWGKGLMAEAVNCVIAYLFEECHLDFLTCGHFNFNQQSARVQEKCGFVPYRTITFTTRFGTKEEGILNLLLNPEKNLVLSFSHLETLIYKS